ncbi:DoxX family protein [Immundisolibacter sp.]|uniref:DoxX family protein n=1 Tax=Immundisolibacter sp. TaxID=1934948 RepID=UPI000ED5CB8D|nr:DoxX family protein [Gammaproteobacteria bacterium]
MNTITCVLELTQRLYRGLDRLAPAADLALRLYVANIFWKAGLVKIQSWSSTLYLFEYEYAVPLLPPTAAAYLGTGIELVFPVLLALGLTGRLAAAVLFAFNIMAVVSYPALNAAGVADHQLWGLLLAVLVVRGPGALSLDRLLWPPLRRRLGLPAPC